VMDSVSAALNKRGRQEAYAMRASSRLSRNAMHTALAQQPASVIPYTVTAMSGDGDGNYFAGGDGVSMSSHDEYISDSSSSTDDELKSGSDPIPAGHAEDDYQTYVVELNSNRSRVIAVRQGNIACIFHHPSEPRIKCTGIGSVVHPAFFPWLKGTTISYLAPHMMTTALGGGTIYEFAFCCATSHEAFICDCHLGDDIRFMLHLVSDSAVHAVIGGVNEHRARSYCAKAITAFCTQHPSHTGK